MLFGFASTKMSRLRRWQSVKAGQGGTWNHQGAERGVRLKLPGVRRGRTCRAATSHAAFQRHAPTPTPTRGVAALTRTPAGRGRVVAARQLPPSEVELVALRQVAPRRAAQRQDGSQRLGRPLNAGLFCRSATKPT